MGVGEVNPDAGAMRSIHARVPIGLYPPNPSPAAARRALTTSIYIIGLGGTGGWLAPHVSRRVWRLQQLWRQVAETHPAQMVNAQRRLKLIFVDPDIVEWKNIQARQNFAPCDIAVGGLPKATVMALRYSLPWGIEIEARQACFAPEWISASETSVLLDCTDNAAARMDINAALRRNAGEEWPYVWWLFAGNARTSGMVCLGNTATVDELAGSLEGKVCGRVPSPALQEPGILVAQPEEVARETDSLSCEDMVLADEQSPTINPHMAVWLDTYLHGLLFGGLTLFNTHVNVEGGSTTSLHMRARDLATKFKRDPAFFVHDVSVDRRSQPAPLPAGEVEGD